MKDAAEDMEGLSHFVGDEASRSHIIDKAIHMAEEGSIEYGFAVEHWIRTKKSMAGEQRKDSGLSMKQEARRVRLSVLDCLATELSD